MFASRRNPLAGNVAVVRRDLQEILSSGNFYVTDEIRRELNAVSNGLDHLKLDGDLSTSGALDSKSSESGAYEVLSQTARVLSDYRSKMGMTSVQNSQENEIRELHHWAIQKFRNLQKDIAPFTVSAAERIQQFGDHIGVTDRYTGYRHNLTRPREPVKLEAKWMGKGTQGGALSDRFTRSLSFADNFETRSPPASASGVRFGTSPPLRRDVRGFQTVDSLYPRSHTMYVDKPATYSQQLMDLKTSNALNATPVSASADNIRARGPKNLSVQEQAGINTTFPGKTEYMTRYKRPPTDPKTSHFSINPSPDFTVHGRPLGLTTYTPSFTEYQTRYEWPDGNKIVKLPWRRQ